MKNIYWLCSIILPSLSIKALAHQLNMPSISEQDAKAESEFNGSLNLRETKILQKYALSSVSERESFLWKVHLTQNDQPSEILNTIAQSKVTEILGLTEEQQQERVIKAIRTGGNKWGSIGDPSDACR